MVDGYQARPGEDFPSAWSYMVDDHYFPLMETRIVRGRAFDDRDTALSPRVAIVNETLAARAWPNRDPSIKVKPGSSENRAVRIGHA